MWNDPTLDNLFTGYADGDEWIYPTATQDLVIDFGTWYLAASDNDFTTDGVTITSEAYSTPDLTYGHAPAKVLTATMLNPDGLMETVTWGNGKVYIGVETGTASAYTIAGCVAAIEANGNAFGITDGGDASVNGTTYTLGGDPRGVLSNEDGDDVYFFTDTKIGRYVLGAFSLVSTPTAEQTFLQAKFINADHPFAIAWTSAGRDVNIYGDDVGEGEAGLHSFSFVPMGTFNFAGVEAYGDTFQIEAYDLMPDLFGGSGKVWASGIDYSTATVGSMLTSLAASAGLSATFVDYAGSYSVRIDQNYVMQAMYTKRQLLQWLCEACGVNAVMSRTPSTLELKGYNKQPVATITPDTIICSTRVEGHSKVPWMTHYAVMLSTGIGDVIDFDDIRYPGYNGTTYYTIGNPYFADDGDYGGLYQRLVSHLGLKNMDFHEYYPVTLRVACFDPRIDAGDYIKIVDEDGNENVPPIARLTLTWNGMCTAIVESLGRPRRKAPEGYTNETYLETVNSNPTVLVDKIEAIGITARRVEVKDVSDNIIFLADADTEEVQIAGFTVDDTSMSATVTYPATPSDATQTITVGTEGLQSTYEYMEGTSQGYAQATRTIDLSNGGLVLDNELDDPNEGYHSQTTVNGGTYEASDVDDPSNYIRHDVYGDSVRTTMSKTDGTEAVIEPNKVELTDANGNTLTIAAPGPSIDEDNGTANSVASGSTTNVTSVSLPAGTSLITLTARFGINATGIRRIILSNSSGGSAPNILYSDTRQALSGSTYETTCRLTACRSVASDTTMYFNVYHNAGTALNVDWRYQVTRLA